jgi:hypothetical protein
MNQESQERSMSRFAAPLTALALALGTAGCGDPDVENKPGGDPTDKVNQYLPLAVGNWWTFAVNDDSVQTDKTTEVLEIQKVGGTGPNADLDAFFVRTTKTNSTNEDKTESWQGTVELGEGRLATVRYREIAYHAMNGMKELEEHWNPYKLRVDNFHTVADGEWDEVYTESKIPADTNVDPTLDSDRYDTWSVQDDAATITVHAGTFTAIHLHRRGATGASSDKDYWFVKGIGKVQETGSQTESLVDCMVGGKTCAELVGAQ